MNNLKNFRLKAGLSQFQLAKISNVAPSEISKLETGVIARPFPAWRKRLAKALKVSEKELWGE